MKKAYYRRIPIYYDPCTEEIEGRNWFYAVLLYFMLWIDVNITFNFVDFETEGFPIRVEVDDKDQEILGIKRKDDLDSHDEQNDIES